ncbi:MAG: orotate phosphoribosyltransferase-like protein [Candidatus Hydrothermarchaeota archaeon]
MKSLEDLINKAMQLKEEGLATGEIADDLNVSKETALWLITKGSKKQEAIEAPRDVYIDWSTLGGKSTRIRFLALAMTDMLMECLEENELPIPDVVIGIATSGVPLATLIAEELDATVAIVRPRKHMWDPEKKIKRTGFFSTTFSNVSGKNVVIVDDIITSGSTIRDIIELLKDVRADPLAAIVIVDKKGIDKINGVPVKSLMKVKRVEEI